MRRRTRSSPIILLAGALALNSCGGSPQASTRPSPTTAPAQPATGARPTAALPPTAEPDATAAAQPVTSAPAQPTTAVATPEQAVAPEQNPAGDIPDTQLFVRYVAPGGFSLEVPEGWARSTSGSDVRFVDKLDGVQIVLSDTTSAPTAE